MLSAVVLVLTTVVVLSGAGLVSAALGLRDTPGFLLATYVIAYAEIVLAVGFLSLGHWVVRWTIIGAAALGLAASTAIWRVTRPTPVPTARRAALLLTDVLKDAPVALLAIFAFLTFLYLGALALFTPPNSVDAMWYHLARAAFWKQQHGVGYIAHANDARLNGSPPVGEIAVLYTIVVSRVDRYVTLIALAGYVAMTMGVFGIGRRFGFARREALCAALVFSMLPVVVLQASGALNDLVVGSFLTTCLFFCLGRTDGEVVLAGVALALAFATKPYAPLALPIIGLIVTFGTPRARALKLALAAIPAIVVGSTWNLINLAKTGSFEGRINNRVGGPLTHGALDLVATPLRYLINFSEIPGARGWWIVCYLVAGLPLAVWFVRKLPIPTAWALIGTALLAATPFLVAALVPTITRGYRFVFFHLGRPDLGILDYGRSVFASSPMISYYGPIGVAFLIAPIVVFLRRRKVDRALVVTSAAPILFLVLLTPTIGFGPLNGRYFVFAIALTAASFSIFLSNRLILWTVIALAVPTVFLALRADIEKPPSVWGQPRWKVQTLAGLPALGEVNAIRFADSLPAKAHIGLDFWNADWSFPFFGSHFQHVVSFVPSTSSIAADVDWLVVAPDKPGPPAGWREVVRAPDDFRVYERQVRNASRLVEP
jgi:hypothetical protein